MVKLFDTTYISADLVQYEIFCAKVGSGDIKWINNCTSSNNHTKSNKLVLPLELSTP